MKVKELIAELQKLDQEKNIWNVYDTLMVYPPEIETAHPDVIGSFTHNGNTLRVFGLYFSVRDAGDQKVEDPDVLHTLGLHQLEEDLKVLKLDGSEMQLETATLRLYFRKY